MFILQKKKKKKKKKFDFVKDNTVLQRVLESARKNRKP